MAEHQKSRFEEIGSVISERASDLCANPFMQIGVILFCGGWFAIGLPTDLLTAALSILAITLTQMVLNRQIDRETDAHRRDIALHAKLDELIIAKHGARDEMAGIEELDEEAIIDLKVQAEKQAEELDEELHEQSGDKPKKAAKG
ncbi:MAG: low affinity iron permease family protein [Sphingomonas sp.]|uniref:low affinity iron permease family protein n=1 Tax=Sphingomonas sp. TaxID=28214 RepID=UPI00179B796A|nr:low affinity iron permease family protein [Sphingomonas sp.]MBA3668075.1 low affinity iron permease family protein [Sphingomonas sp.]